MRILAEMDGRFGPARVLERKSDGARLYCIGQSAQTFVGADGVSLFGYVHAAKLILRSARKVLLIGGGGGSLATMLARRDHDVTVLDIDPLAEHIARTYFWLDARVKWITADIATFYQARIEKFDAVCVDACDANGLANGFADADFLVALHKQACPNGSLVVNVVHEDGVPPRGEELGRTLARQGLQVTLYEPQDGWEGNEILHVRTKGRTDVLDLSDIFTRPPETRTYLLSLRPAGR